MKRKQKSVAHMIKFIIMDINIFRQNINSTFNVFSKPKYLQKNLKLIFKN